MTQPNNPRAPIQDVEEISVWIIEDNERYRTSLKQIVNARPRLSCQQDFSNCEDALKALKDSYPPELFLLDLGLPGMGGIEGITHFRRITPSSKIIILTIDDDSNSVFKAICAGASGYLLKEAPSDKIIEGIEEVLEGGAVMNAQIAKKVMDFLFQTNSSKGEYGLTDREKEILKFVVDGKSKKQIAENLFVSYHTVNTHLKNVYKKLQVSTSAGAVSKVIREKLL